MKILNESQYNQGIGRSKLLSSNAGVGSILTTKIGAYVLIHDINKWKFIEWANHRISQIREEESESSKIYDRSKGEINNRGLSVVDDIRFVEFLKIEKEMPSLVCLINIPHMTLNESFNTPNWRNHPIKSALDRNNENGQVSDYMIVGSHFPKWFYSTGGKKRGSLKLIEEWRNIWDRECLKHDGVLKKNQFVPPRDGNDYIRQLSSKNSDGVKVPIREYRVLNQLNLVLICKNGHLSDIPWPKYIRWKLYHQFEDAKASGLFGYDDCCSNPDLVWTESKNKSEGYASVFIHCNSCSSSNEFGSKVNLEGINGISPLCQGEKPWEKNPRENGAHNEVCREEMRVALVTANNLYYASGFSSLYIPLHLAKNTPKELNEAIAVCEEKYSRILNTRFERSKEQWFEDSVNEEFLQFDCGILVSDLEMNIVDFIELLKAEFVNTHLNEVDDSHEEYRWQEYQCFTNNDSIPDLPENNGLKFNDIELPIDLKPFFAKIQQLEELKITQVQLDFTRVEPRDRIVKNGIVNYNKEAKNIYSKDSKELFLLPANESLGEGLFFQFDDSTIDNWLGLNSHLLSKRFNKFMTEPSDDIQGAAIRRKIFSNGGKQFLIHSFAHLIMRELEFSCGYPTASLKERLYISNNPEMKMSGVLIYTSEGAEGSMGGLVSQGRPLKILDIIKKGLLRMESCSSDPLCWESDGQGIFDLNMASCFSCSMVAETACEEMNLALDRRVLMDMKFGFFKSLIEGSIDI